MIIYQQKFTFTCSDGKEYLHEDAAVQHEAHLNLYTLLEQHSVGRGGMWDTEMFRDFLIEHRAEILTALQPEIFNT